MILGEAIASRYSAQTATLASGTALHQLRRHDPAAQGAAPGVPVELLALTALSSTLVVPPLGGHHGLSVTGLPARP
jgi:hypothetical protein